MKSKLAQGPSIRPRDRDRVRFATMLRVPLRTGAGDLGRLRSLEALAVLRLLAEHVKVDETFKPRRALSTQRVHVSAAGGDWELLVDGARFYDVRARRGGGGAIDLVMHLWQVPFKKAIAVLIEKAGWV